MAYMVITKVVVLCACVLLYQAGKNTQATLTLVLAIALGTRWLVYSFEICKYLEHHEPGLEAESRAVRYAVALHVVSVLQVFLSGLLCGYTGPQGEWDRRGTVMLTLSVACVIVLLVSGLGGLIVTTGFLLSNSPSILVGKRACANLNAVPLAALQHPCILCIRSYCCCYTVLVPD
jgi:hypothetical protein